MRKVSFAFATAFLFSAGLASAAHVWEDPDAWWNSHWVYVADAPKYTDNELSLDLFGSYSAPEKKFEDVAQTNIRHDGWWGGGVGLNYFFIKYLGIEGDVNFGDHSGKVVDQVLGNGVLRLPIGNTGLAPYVFGGGGRGISAGWEWVYDAGAGLEFRFTPATGLFADARYMWPDHTADRLMIRAGMRFAF